MSGRAAATGGRAAAREGAVGKGGLGVEVRKRSPLAKLPTHGLHTACCIAYIYASLDGICRRAVQQKAC